MMLAKTRARPPLLLENLLIPASNGDAFGRISESRQYIDRGPSILAMVLNHASTWGKHVAVGLVVSEFRQYLKEACCRRVCRSVYRSEILCKRVFSRAFGWN